MDTSFLFTDEALLTPMESLQLNEKISFVFLITTDYQEGYYLTQKLKSSESAIDENAIFRQFLLSFLLKDKNQFTCMCIEILILLKNFRVLRMLGFHKTVKDNVNFSGNINQLRRHLYLLADSLTEQQTSGFVKSVCGKELGDSQLEETILQWAIDGIVSLELDNCESIMKMTQYFEHYEVTDRIKELFNSLLDKKFIPCSLESEYYPIINPNEMGFCVVINQDTFTRSKELQHLLPEETLTPRPGSEIDIKSVQEIFSWLRFKVLVHTNISFPELQLLLSDYAQSIAANHSQFILVLMSHGTEDVIYTADSVPVRVEDIEMSFQAKRCPNLVGKPKILLVQACQGKKLQRIMLDGLTDSPSSDTHAQTLPERGDALIAWSTVKGFASFRDRLQGSWFIQELCSELKRSAHSRDLVDIVTRVNNNLRHKTCQGMHMVPSLSTSLCKKIRFPVYNKQ